MRDWLHDLRYAGRVLRQNPTFTLITVLTLALAIGVTSAIFSMVSVVFFSNIPIRDGDTVGFFYVQNPARGLVRQLMSMEEFLAYRDGVGAFESMVALRQDAAILTGGDEPVRVVVGEATANFFDTWRTQPVLGRGFRAGEDTPGAQRVVILSHGMWERRFAADRGLLGTTIAIDGTEATIVGVMGPEMEFGDISRIDIWRPIVLERLATASERRDLFVTARLAPEMTLEQARPQAAVVAQQMERDFPEVSGGWMPQIQSFNEGLADQSFWTVLTLLVITVGFVMTIACSNIATMMMARSETKAREIAVRSALGAGRARLLRGLVTEGALLSIAAALLGLLVARLGLEGLVWMAGDNAGISTFFKMLTIDRHVLSFTLLVAALAPLLFSLLPALRATRRSPRDALGDGGRTSGGVGALRGRRFLVATQVALALALMIVAGLLVRTMINVRSLDLGYDGDALLTMRIDLPELKYDGPARQLEFFRSVSERLLAHPDIETAAWTSRRPMAERAPSSAFQILGRPAEHPRRLPWAGLVIVDTAYPDLLELEVLRGRAIADTDSEDSTPVVVVNRAAAERYWRDEEPIGQRVRLARDGDADRWRQIVGVIDNDTPLDPTEPTPPVMFVPLRQAVEPSMALIVRPRGPALDAAPLLRELIWQVDADQPVADVRTMRQVFNDAVAGVDAVMSMLATFAAFALLMAAAGVYGVMSFVVAQRTREFGVRMALGAAGSDVRTMVMRGSAPLVAGGTIVGLLGGYALGRILATADVGVVAHDPIVFITVGAILSMVALISIYIPARRATRVDPIVALRAD